MRPWLARLLVFGSSAAVLVLEILAGRIMAPYIGVTLETFTGIIGVVLAGIAAGSWLGGRAADRVDPRTLPGPLLVASGALALAIPAVVDGLGPAMRGGGPLEIVILTASGFFLPSFLLSAVTPIVTRLMLRALEHAGGVVGSFSAISTAGALAGTFLTGFVFVVAWPTRPIVLGVGVALILAGLPLLGHTVSRRTRLGSVAVVLVAAASLALSRGPCDEQTNYFCAVIRLDPDRPSGRVLQLDTLTHSYVDLEDPAYLDLRYAQLVAEVIEELPPGPLESVYIGGGGFTLPRYVRSVRPGSEATVFEVDGALVRLVERELGLERGPDLRVELGDARLGMLEVESGSLDLVVGDAFGGLSVPWHLTTREFVEEIARSLAPSGVYVLNVIDYPPLGFARAEVATLLDVFPHVAVIAPLPYLEGARGGNFVLVGSHQRLPWETVQARFDERVTRERVWANERAREFASDARVLRDDFAPVDQLLSHP